MKRETFTVDSKADGLTLSVLVAEPEGEVRGLVQIAHGMSEYKERYLGFLEALTEAGYAAMIHDHRDHGASVATDADLGWFGPDGARALVLDIRQLTEMFQAQHPGKPLCLFGHSMGSLAARAYAREDDRALTALIVCGCPGENPAAGAGLQLVKAIKRVRGDRHRSGFIDKLVNGGMQKRMPEGSSKFAWLNTDQDAVAAYENDEKCGFPFTLSGFEGLFTLMRRAYAKTGWAMKKPDLPVLFISGADDPCMVSRKALDRAAKRMREVGYKDVRVKVYEGMRHEILLEPGRADVYADVKAFLGKAFV